MDPYVSDTLPLDSIDWAAHVSLIGQANAALARYDGIPGCIKRKHLKRCCVKHLEICLTQIIL